MANVNKKEKRDEKPETVTKPAVKNVSPAKTKCCANTPSAKQRSPPSDKDKKDVAAVPVKLKTPEKIEKPGEKPNEKPEKKEKPMKSNNDWQKELAESIDGKMKEFVEKICTLETETRLSTHFLNELMNMAFKDQKYTKFVANPQKNRNPDVFCTETTRVKLKSTDGKDYIHANYITIDNSKKAYIATQHPMASTMDDFWNMVFNESIEVIVSLTNLVGPDFPIYYPHVKNSYAEYGNYQVICKSVKQGPLKYGPLVYTLEIVPNGCSHSLIVQLLKYSHWGKNLVPSNTRVVMSLVKYMNKMKSFAPILVQCETGVNQSAVLIYVDALFSLLLENQSVDIDAVFTNIRKQRASMLSQRIHFIYSIYVVLDFIRLRFHHNNIMPEVLNMIENIEKPICQEFAKFISTEAPDNRANSPGSADLLF